MKRSDDVFFFTLIDFLIQVFFFGLLLYVLAQVTQIESEKQREAESHQVKKLLQATGVSNLTELTDELTKMAPIKEMKGFADFISAAGGINKVIADQKIIHQAGGAENVSVRLEKLRRLEEGSGKPPCIFEFIGDKKIAKHLATVVATDTSITFQGRNSSLDEVLRLLRRDYESIRVLSLTEFQKAFAGLVQIKPECRYSLRFIEKTRLVDARDSAGSTFYLNIGKQ